jgi:hypothetical protein
MIDMTRKPTRQDLRWFGAIVLVFFSVLAAVARFKLHAPAVAAVLVGVGVVLAVLYYLVKPLRVPLYLAWMRIFFPLGWIVSHTIVAVIYYLIVTPIGLLMRLFGRDPMQRRLDRSAATYWVPTRRDAALSQYFRQY